MALCRGFAVGIELVLVASVSGHETRLIGRYVIGAMLPRSGAMSARREL